MKLTIEITMDSNAFFTPDLKAARGPEAARILRQFARDIERMPMDSGVSGQSGRFPEPLYDDDGRRIGQARIE